MDRREIEDRVTRILVEHLNLDAEKVKPGSSLIDDLGADSLDMVELVMAAEEVFDIQISDDEAEQMVTVRDAVSGIEKKLAA